MKKKATGNMLGLLAISVLTLLNTNPASANELHD